LKENLLHCVYEYQIFRYFMILQSFVVHTYTVQYLHRQLYSYTVNCIGDVMVSVLASSAVDRGLEPWSGQTKDYKIGICCFSTKHAALRRKSKDWFAHNQNNVSEWSDMSTHRLLFQ
jgi:hypothetical protein